MINFEQIKKETNKWKESNLLNDTQRDLYLQIENELSSDELPGTNNEYWKYTNSKIFARETVAITKEDNLELGKFINERKDSLNFKDDVLVFVNGKLAKEYSSKKSLEVLKEQVQLEEIEFQNTSANRISGLSTKSIFNGLRKLLSPHAIMIKIEEDRSIDILNVFHGSQELPCVPRLFVEVNNSQKCDLRIKNEYHSTFSGRVFGEFNFLLLKSAILNVQFYDKTEPNQDNLFRINSSCGQEAKLNICKYLDTKSNSRWEVESQLLSEDSALNLMGAYYVREGGHLDVRPQAIHNGEKSLSRQLYKGVIADKARAVFNGRIFIDQDAQEVDSSMYNQNLLHGNNAEVDTKPELEIYADNVKANHGTTVGQLSDDQLFYLMSRGLKKIEAEALLKEGFLKDVSLTWLTSTDSSSSKNLYGEFNAEL